MVLQHLVACAILVGGCDPLAPLSNVNPELSDIEVEMFPSAHGVLKVSGIPSDETFRLPFRRRVQLMISTSGGDAEAVALYRHWCPPHRKLSFYDCHSVILYTRSGVAVTDLEARILELGGRLGYVSPFSSSWATVVFLTPSGLMLRRQQMLDWSEVADVALDQPGCIECDPQWLNEVQAALAAAIPLEPGTPEVGDGILQLSPGETVTATYTNPSGTSLIRTFAAPPT